MLGNTQAVLTGVQRAGAVGVKSVIFDYATNHAGSHMAHRAIDFFNGGVKLAIIASTPATYYGASLSGLIQDFIFHTELSKTGTQVGTSWLNTLVAQRVIAVFGTPIVFDRIDQSNYHDSGGVTTRGANAVKIHTSTDAITSLVYDEAIANSTLIYDGVFRIHSGGDVVDTETLVLI